MASTHYQMPKNEPPPGGWRFLVTQTSTLIKGDNEADLIAKIKGHMKANNIYDAYGQIPQEVRKYICERQPDYCRGMPRGQRRSLRSRVAKMVASLPSLKDVINFSRAYLGPIEKKDFAPKATIVQRSRVCQQCPLNVRHTACIPCSSPTFLNHLKSKLGAIYYTVSPFNLKVCKACGCMLNAKVVLKIEDVLRLTPKDKFDLLHPTCWIRTEKEKSEKT